MQHKYQEMLFNLFENSYFEVVSRNKLIILTL